MKCCAVQRVTDCGTLLTTPSRRHCMFERCSWNLYGASPIVKGHRNLAPANCLVLCLWPERICHETSAPHFHRDLAQNKTSEPSTPQKLLQQCSFLGMSSHLHRLLC